MNNPGTIATDLQAMIDRLGELAAIVGPNTDTYLRVGAAYLEHAQRELVGPTDPFTGADLDEVAGRR